MKHITGPVAATVFDFLGLHKDGTFEAVMCCFFHRRTYYVAFYVTSDRIFVFEGGAHVGPGFLKRLSVSSTEAVYGNVLKAFLSHSTSHAKAASFKLSVIVAVQYTMACVKMKVCELKIKVSLER